MNSWIWEKTRKTRSMRKERDHRVGVFLLILAAVNAAQGVRWRRNGRMKRNVFSSSSSSSSWSSSFESSGAACLNGGTSVPSLTTGLHMFCLCGDAYEGPRCETLKSSECYEGVGLYYRGMLSRSHSGLTCQEWDQNTREGFMGSDVHGGRHNHCRNLFYRRRPWCYVWKNQQLVWEYCDIPRCGADSPPASAAPAAATTPPAEFSPRACGIRTRPRQMKIVGGTVATVEAHPWMAAIFWRAKSKEKVFRCGGSLISPCWVLTAAHCFPDGSHAKARRFSVVLGKNVLNESDPTSEQKFKVEKIVVHEAYDNSRGNFVNDIALMQLKRRHGNCAAETKSVNWVCLPSPRRSLSPGVSCEITGYGKEKQGLWYRSQNLREAQVRILSEQECSQQRYYGNLITANMLCAAGAEWTQDACQGDSGGPLVCEVEGRLFQYGIISWGDGCAREFRPGVYAKVQNFLHWIQEKTSLMFDPGEDLPDV